MFVDFEIFLLLKVSKNISICSWLNVAINTNSNKDTT